MSRHTKITLLIGALVSLPVVAGLQLGLFRFWDHGMWAFLGFRTAPPEAFPGLQIVMVLLMAFGLAWTTIDILKPGLKILVALVALSELFTAAWLLAFHQILFSPFAPAIAGTAAFLAALLFVRSPMGERKRLVLDLFGERISRENAHRLINSSLPLDLAGAETEATVLVVEIFNHEELLEVLPVTEYVELNNRFLAVGGEVMKQHGGYLDECHGESLRAVFNVPVPNPAHAETVCKAALELLSKLDELNSEAESRWHQRMDFRIGLNTGSVIAAVYGAARCGRFSVSGETVEFASRLAAGNLGYESRILIGSTTYQAVAESMLARPLELLRRRDEQLPREVYELLCVRSDATREEEANRDRFWDAVLLFREQRFSEALETFKKCRREGVTDLPLENYIRRLEKYAGLGKPSEWESARLMNGI